MRPRPETARQEEGLGRAQRQASGQTSAVIAAVLPGTHLPVPRCLGHSPFCLGEGLGTWELAHPGVERTLSHLLAVGLGTLSPHPNPDLPGACWLQGWERPATRSAIVRQALGWAATRMTSLKLHNDTGRPLLLAPTSQVARFRPGRAGP